MTFNLAELSTEQLLTYTEWLYKPSWTFYWITFNLAELSTEQLLT